MNIFDIRTVLLVTGLMHLIMPVMVWLALRAQKSHTVKLWVAGGEIFGLGLVLMSLRGHTPDWLNHELSNFCFYFGYLLRIQALKFELRQPMPKYGWALSLLGMCTGYVALRQATPDPTGHFIWSALIVGMLCLWIHHLARQIARREQLQSATWLAYAYIPLAIILLIRAAQVVSGTAQAGLLVDDFAPMAIALAGIFSAVMGNTSFLGMFAERATRQQLQQAQMLARQDESARLGRQISQLDRQRGMGMLATSLAHELSQPLTNISLIVDVGRLDYKKRGITEASLLQYFEDIQHNVNNAAEVMQRIRNFIKPQDLIQTNVVLQDVVQNAIRLMSGWLRTEHVQLSTDLPETPTTVAGDPVQLAQILVNLLRNAVQASTGTTVRQVTLRLETQAGYAILEVLDNGPGFCRELLEGSSGMFYTTKSDGLGVGLSISRHIAELHGGSIGLKNGTPGGAVVTLSLPLTSMVSTEVAKP